MFSGSLTALITPFTEKGELDKTALVDLIDWQIEQGSDGIVCCGTTAESPTLSDEEKEVILTLCVERGKNRVPIIMGTGSNATEKSYLLTKRAKELGADGALIITPYYNKPNEKGCIAHFSKIAEAHLPLILYYHPGRTGIVFSSSTFLQICSLPEVVAIKEASGELTTVEKIPKRKDLPILSGNDDATLDLIGLGAKGTISVLSNLLPKQWKEMVELAVSNRREEGEKIYKRYEKLVKAIFLEVNPQGIKYALSLIGKCKPIYRLPLLEPEEKTKIEIAQALKELHII